MSRKKSLENIVKRQDNHVKHFDPIDAISHHVVFLIFIAIMFLMGVFLFFAASPGPDAATTYALYEFEPITIHKEIGESVSNFVENVRNSENRPLVLLILYTFWIIIFGLINMVLFERNVRK